MSCSDGINGRAGVTIGYVLVGACRLADGGYPGAVVNNAHVVINLIQRLPAARIALGLSLRELRRALADLPREVESVAGVRTGTGRSREELDLELAVDGALREARWLTVTGAANRRKPVGVPAPEFGLDVREALRRSLLRAGTDGVRWASSVYLFDEVLTSAGDLGYELLVRCGVEPARLVDAVRTAGNAKDDRPPLAMTDTLRAYGAATPGRLRRALGRLLEAAVTRSTGTATVIRLLEREAVRHAVRLDHSVVTTAHLLLAICALEVQVELDAQIRPEEPLPADLLRGNRGGAVLKSHGVRYEDAVRLAATSPEAEEQIPSTIGEPPAGSREPRNALRTSTVASRPLEPTWSQAARTAVADAREASERSGEVAGSTQLLISMLAQPESAAAGLISGLGGDPTVVAEDCRRTLTPS